MSDTPDNVSPEVLGIMQRAQANAKTAQQMFQMTINSVFEQYSLASTDKIDIQTGKITRAVSETEEPRHD